MGLKSDILGNRRLPVSEPITVPGWKVKSADTLHFRTMTGRECDIIDQKAVSGDLAGMRGLFAALVLGDKDGNRIFGDDDVDALGNMQADPLGWILDHGKAFNDIDQSEDFEGNSGAAQEGGSGSE